MNYKKLNHTTWDCKYHLVWIPKYRKKVIYGKLRQYLGEVFKELALQKESQILEGHLMGDHVHMLISIQVFSIPGCRIYKRKKCNPYCENLCWQTSELYWAEFLGQRLFRLNGRA